MTYQRTIMTAEEIFIEQIGNILNTDVDFLLKLSPKELGILATSLKGLVDREKKYILRDYRQKPIDL
jgi:hypothetical protein